jgi:RimJ/RimL family protein N-acetyltransferase
MITFRFADINDAKLYFDWANDTTVRKNSYQKDPISFENHIKWFTNKLNSPDCFFYLFLAEGSVPAGQVRIDKSGDEIIIGISIDEKFRGKHLGSEMLIQASDDYLMKFPEAVISAYIKEDNISSIKAFEKAGFKDPEKVVIEGSPSYKLKKQKT